MVEINFILDTQLTKYARHMFSAQAALHDDDNEAAYSYCECNQ